MSAAIDDLSDVALAVIAGGRGARMGRPKSGLLLDGKPILHALLDGVDWPGPTVLSVAAGQELFPGSERFTRIVTDRHPDQGPLGGLVGVLEDALVASPAPCRIVIAIPVDMPFVRRKQLAWLASQLKARPDKLGLMIARTASGGSPQVEPFPSAYRTSFAPIAGLRLRQQKLALRALATEPTVETIAPPADWPEETWTNLNTPADLESLRKHE